MDQSAYVMRLDCHPSHPFLCVVGLSRGGMITWDVRMRTSVQTYRPFIGQVQDVLFTSDHQYLISASDIIQKDKTITVWDVRTVSKKTDFLLIQWLNIYREHHYQIKYLMNMLQVHLHYILMVNGW
jgi:WD40 repeat protein